jgi:hypothetical protein
MRGPFVGIYVSALVLMTLLEQDVLVVAQLEPWIESRPFDVMYEWLVGFVGFILLSDVGIIELRRHAYRSGGRGAPSCLYCGHEIDPSIPWGPTRCSECGRAIVACRPDVRRPSSRKDLLRWYWFGSNLRRPRR